MGLDMYLSQRVTVEAETAERLASGLGIERHRDADWTPAAFEPVIGYWRKANHIHGYFANRLGYRAGRLELTIGDLERLERLCLEILDMAEDGGGHWILHASSLLPRVDGPFFGSQDYDQGYLDDLSLTVEIVDLARRNARSLLSVAIDEITYVYEANW